MVQLFSKLKIPRLFVYYFAVTLLLFISGQIGQLLGANVDIEKDLLIFIQGFIFTGFTLLFLYFIYKNDRKILYKIGLKKPNSIYKFIVGASLPIILIVLGLISSLLFGVIQDLQFHFTSEVIGMVLINIVVAFLYEAFPEEIFVRGLIFNELRKKNSFLITLLIQPFIFLCIPLGAMLLANIFFSAPIDWSFDKFILLYFFGFALQLYRIYTDTLWSNIIFHLIYLETTRFIALNGAYNGKSLITFNESSNGIMVIYLSFLIAVLFSIFIISILLIVNKYKQRRK